MQKTRRILIGNSCAAIAFALASSFFCSASLAQTSESEGIAVPPDEDSPTEVASWSAVSVGGGVAGPVSQATVAYIGSPGAKIQYTWWVEGGSSVCAYGATYAPGGGSNRIWHSAGCGSSGTGTFDWGNSAGYPAMQVTSYLGYSIIRWHLGP